MRHSFKKGLYYLSTILIVADPNIIQHWLNSGCQTNGSAQATESGRQANGRSDVAAQDSKTKDLAPLIKKLRALSDPKRLPERLDLLEKAAKGGSRAAFDVKAKAKELGSGINRIFAFVRDEVRYEAYEGVLRGPRGTLMALAGNSFDKSLLLAELLKEHGVAVRFVRGRLNGERAETLITQMFAAVKLKKRPAPKKEKSTTLPKEMREASDAFVNLNIARWLSSVETVGAALRRAKIRIADEPPVPKKALVAEATDHLWIEIKQGETWTAFDPSFKDAKPGKSYALRGAAAESVPPTAHHRVSIRLRLEERGTGGVKTRDVLQHEATAAELNGVAVSLRHAISATKTDWTATPVLRIEEKEFRGQKITGTVGLAEGVTALGKRLFKRPEGKALEQGMTAMWLDFEFVYPSGRKETVRREIFDRIGLVARNEKKKANAQLTPLPSLGMPYPMAGAFALSFSSGTLAPGLAQQRFALLLPSLRKTLAKTKDRLSDEEKQRLLTGTMNLMATSSHLSSQANIRAARQTGVWGNVHFYEATSRVCVVSAVQEKPSTIGITLDLRRNDLRPVGDGVAGAKILWANVTRGILDAAVEHVLFVDTTPTSPTTLTPLSTIVVFDGARSADVQVGAISDRKGLASLIVPAEAKARLSAGLHEKVALIMPAKGIRLGRADRLGWWRVDLQSGETLAIVDNGLHAGGTEYGLLSGVGVLLLEIVVAAAIPVIIIAVALVASEILVELGWERGSINRDATNRVNSHAYGGRG